MQREVLTKHDPACSRSIIALILEHSEDMLILAYALTHNAPRATKIVENILLDIHLQNNLEDHMDSPHTYLYNRVKEACNESASSLK